MLKYPDDDDRLIKVFKERMLNHYGARKTIEQMDADSSLSLNLDRDKFEYVDFFTHFIKQKSAPQLKYLFIDEAQDSICTTVAGCRYVAKRIRSTRNVCSW